MEKNMGLIDRWIRVILAAVIVTLYLTEVISGTAGVLLLALSAVLLVTSLIGSCPLYLPFGLNTLRKKRHV
jgi:di/tricarboxylate transporter